MESLRKKLGINNGCKAEFDPIIPPQSLLVQKIIPLVAESTSKMITCNGDYDSDTNNKYQNLVCEHTTKLLAPKWRLMVIFFKRIRLKLNFTHYNIISKAIIFGINGSNCCKK